jgi:hypothetical protein
MKMDFLQRLAAFAESEGYELSGLEDTCGSCEGIRCVTRDVRVSFRCRTLRADPKVPGQAPGAGSQPARNSD